MRVLILSGSPDLIEDTVVASGCDPVVRMPDLEVSDWPKNVDWVISFGYRKIVPAAVLKKFEGRVINLHNSLLPFNKGAHPNFWSWWDKTPKGVSIHKMTDSLDGGQVLCRHIVAEFDFRPTKTLKSTYDDLMVAASGLFKRNWIRILSNDIVPPAAYEHVGTYHRVKDLDPFFRLLPRGWDTDVTHVEDMGDLYRGVNGKA